VRPSKHSVFSCPTICRGHRRHPPSTVRGCLLGPPAGRPLRSLIIHKSPFFVHFVVDEHCSLRLTDRVAIRRKFCVSVDSSGRRIPPGPVGLVGSAATPPLNQVKHTLPNSASSIPFILLPTLTFRSPHRLGGSGEAGA